MALSFRRIWEFLAGRLVLAVLALGILAGTAYLFRGPLLRSTGAFLVKEDPRVPCDAIYVLGGSAKERGEEGAVLLIQGIAPLVYCTGSQVPRSLEVIGAGITEAELSRMAALAIGGDPERVRVLNVGTSTWEEAEAILAHAREHGYSDIGLVSTEFHSRRVRRVFRKHAEGTGVRIHVFAAPSQVYDSKRWWQSEEGLLMVNNEYVKSLYYLLRY